MIDAAVSRLGINISCVGNLYGYVDLVERWNRSINLTAAKSRAEIIDHVVDCLHVVPLLTDRARVLDVGAGGGFPSVVEAICLPASSVTAIEPTHKKHAFLRACARELALKNFVALAERLDDHAACDYDAATSRATFDLLDWLSFGLQRVRPGGIVIGFEATPRELPSDVSRQPYAHGDRQRALVVATR